MNEIVKRVRSKLVYAKLFMSRTMTYFAIFNTLMLVFLTVSQLQEYGIHINLIVNIIIVMVATIIMISFGYVEDRMGFFRLESLLMSQRNPYFDEIIERLERLEKKK